MAGTLQVDNISNSAGTGAPNFPNGATFSTSEVLQVDTITNAAGSGAPNFTHGLNTSTGQIITVDKINDSTTNAGVAIQGISGSGSASAGYVGEEVLATTTGTTGGTTTAISNILSITLTAGDWDISAYAAALGNGTIFTANVNGWVYLSTTTASSSGTVVGYTSLQAPQTLGANNVPSFALTLPRFIAQISSTTTYYLNGAITFSAGSTCQWIATLSARRMR